MIEKFWIWLFGETSYGQAMTSAFLQAVAKGMENLRQEEMAKERERIAKERADLFQPTTNLIESNGKPLSKAELLFMNGHDGAVGMNGELLTACYGRWVRTQ